MEIRQVNENINQILGCTSPETAYVVDNFLYGFRLRTQIRYWIETREDCGQRFCHQTLNPKTGVWDNPRYGAYNPVTVFVRYISNGHVVPEALSICATKEEVSSFREMFQLDEAQLNYLLLAPLENARNMDRNSFCFACRMDWERNIMAEISQKKSTKPQNPKR